MRDLILQAADACTGGNVRALAKLIETPERTVRAWMAGTYPAPAVARLLLHILANHPAAAKWIKRE